MITWDLKITPINISTFEASIEATRTDDDPENPSVMVYTVPRAKIETTEDKLAVAQEIRAKHLARMSADEAVRAFVADAEAAGKAYLEGLE